MLHTMSRMGKQFLGNSPSSPSAADYEQQQSDEWLVEVVSPAGRQVVRAKTRGTQLYYFIGDHWVPVATHL